MSRREFVPLWLDDFNAADVDRLAHHCSEDATNHQVAEQPIEGRAAIRAKFVREFAAAEMVCISEQIREDGEGAILEWRNPQGLRSCGYFHVRDDKIVFQRGYWDKLSFWLHGLPLPTH